MGMGSLVWFEFGLVLVWLDGEFEFGWRVKPPSRRIRRLLGTDYSLPAELSIVRLLSTHKHNL